MYSPRLVKEVLKALGKQLVDDGRLDSVSPHSAGPTADFLHKNGRMTSTISKEICSTQSRSRKEKNKGEKVRARLDVREIKKARSEDDKVEPSDLFSAMPPVESLKASVSNLMTERVGRRGRNLVLAVFGVSRAHFHGERTRCLRGATLRITSSWTRSQTQQDDVRDAGCEQCVEETVVRTPPQQWL